MEIWIPVVVAFVGIIPAIIAAITSNKTGKKIDRLADLEHKVDNLSDQIDDVSEKVKINSIGTAMSLRVDMQKLYREHSARGFITSADLTIWNGLYKTYIELGGNDKKETVNIWNDVIQKLQINDNDLF